MSLPIQRSLSRCWAILNRPLTTSATDEAITRAVEVAGGVVLPVAWLFGVSFFKSVLLALPAVLIVYVWRRLTSE